MDKLIVTVLLLISGIVAVVFVTNAVLPAVQRAGSDIVAASDVASTRVRSDIRVIEMAGVAGQDSAKIWVKNVGGVRIAPIEQTDVFFGEVGNFQRLKYDPTTACSNPGRTQSCWQYALENDTEWAPYATLRVTVYLTYTLATGKDYVTTTVIPNGVSASKVMSL